MGTVNASDVTMNEELTVLLTESKRLHEDRRMWDNNIFRLFSLLLSISAVCLAAVIQVRTKSLPSHISQSFYWEILVIAYPYIIYVFTFIFLVLNGAISHNSAYLVYIEKRINEIIGKSLLIWEEQIAQKSFYSLKSSYMYATVLIIISVLILTIYCITFNLELFRETKYYTNYIIINAVAGTIILSLLIYTFMFEKKNIFKSLKRNFKVIILKRRRKKVIVTNTSD
jgi:hypothetical protein